MAELKGTTVNGNLSITGDIEIAGGQKLSKALSNLIYPIGSLYWSSKETDPSNLFDGTTWKRIKDTYIYAAPLSSKGTLGDTTSGGTHTITVEEMPSHKHGINFTSDGSSKSSTGAKGGHSHDRGTMNITGSISCPGRNSEGSLLSGKEAFYTKSNQGNIDATAYGHWSNNLSITYFDASRSWTGSTSPVSDHSHDMTHTHLIKGDTGYTGGGSGGAKTAMPIDPKHIVRYCWERTA